MLELFSYKKAYLLKGTEKDDEVLKAMIKGLGGKWNNALQGWIFPGNKIQQLQQSLQSLFRPFMFIGEYTRPEVEEPKISDTRCLYTYMDSVLLRGIKRDEEVLIENLKRIYGKWNPTLVGWIFPLIRIDQVKQVLTDMDVEFENAGEFGAPCVEGDEVIVL